MSNAEATATVAEKPYLGLQPSKRVPPPPVAPPEKPFTPLGFSEPGDPTIDLALPIRLQFVKEVFLAGKQLPAIDLKNERQFRVRIDYEKQLCWIRYDNGASVAMGCTPVSNIVYMHWGQNPRHTA